MKDVTTEEKVRWLINHFVNILQANGFERKNALNTTAQMYLNTSKSPEDRVLAEFINAAGVYDIERLKQICLSL